MELRILEFLAAFFLLLHLLRPLFKSLWKLDGLSALPVISLAIMISLFPAYGFRPECVPLLIFTLFVNIINIPAFFSLFSQLRNDDYRDRGPVSIVLFLGIFLFCGWIIYYFSPPLDSDLVPEGVMAIQLRDWSRNEDIWVQIYDAPQEPADESGVPAQRPLLLLIPPAAGSVQTVEPVCAALRDRGFIVLTYSRPGFDSPAINAGGAPVRLSLPALYRLANALLRGLEDQAANAGGRELEEGRAGDITFLLTELAQNKTLQDSIPNADRNCVFLAGYGSGGAALTVLAGSADFCSRYGKVRGIISVEGPLLSSLEGEVPPEIPVPADNPVSRGIYRLRVFGSSLVPRKITRIGAVPRPELPILFLVSGRAIRGGGRYETILRTMGAAKNAALLAAAPEAGPFDYSGSPSLYPVYSFLFRGEAAQPGQTGAWTRVGTRNYPELTAALAANFAAQIMENLRKVEPEDPAAGVLSPEEALNRVILAAPPKQSLLEDIHFETGGVFNSTFRYY